MWWHQMFVLCWPPAVPVAIYRPPLPQPYVFVLMMYRVMYESLNKPTPTPEIANDF